MSSRFASSAITRIHHELLDQLAELDRLGEHVASAHLAAAIDALEDRLDAPGATPARDRKNDPVVAMARALVSRFGDRAIEVARRQMEAASGQALLIWASIVSRVELTQAGQTSPD